MSTKLPAPQTCKLYLTYFYIEPTLIVFEPMFTNTQNLRFSVLNKKGKFQVILCFKALDIYKHLI